MIVDFEVLAVLVVAAAVLATLWELIKDLIREDWDAASPRTRRFVGYGIVVVNVGLTALTALNAFPGFSAVWAPGGRILTCIVGGLGPKACYDMFIDRPQVTPQPPANHKEGQGPWASSVS